MKKKADHAFQGENAQLREDYLKRSLNWTAENGQCKLLILLFMKLAAPIQEGGTLSGKLTAQTRRERSRLCDELAMGHRVFQEDRARHCQ